jgi:competence protein ComEC
MSGLAFKPGRRWWTGVVAACIAVFYVWQWQAARGRVEITVLPLNGGSAVYVHSRDETGSLLVDCGNTNAVEFVMKPFLRAQGVNRLPRLVLTHGDLRHVGGAEHLRAFVPVGQIVTSSARFRSAAYRQIIANLEKLPGNRQTVHRGDRLGPWTVLHPGRGDAFAQADDNALVLMGDFRGTRILLLSDLGRAGQEALLELTADLRADIVVACLPERTEPLCDGLLEAICPKLIVIADSEYPATKRASIALRKRLERRAVPVLCTRCAGAVNIVIGKGGWRVRAPREDPCSCF